MAIADRLTIAVCQMGPVERGVPKRDTVARLTALLEIAAARGARFCVFPEIALTTFFPRWVIDDQAELDACFEDAMPNSDVQPLFERARALGIAFALGYGERAPVGPDDDDPRHYNTMALVDEQARVTGTYRKVHVPGTIEPVAGLPVQHLEKRYFRFGDKGFPVWPLLGTRIGLAICNDRRWSETWRVLGLRGAEVVGLGFNTPVQLADYPEMNHLRGFHHLVGMQAGAYENGLWIAAAAKAGVEGGMAMLGVSAIIAPSGEVLAMTASQGDEVITHDADLALARRYKTFFDFAANRQPAAYGPITGPEPGGPGADS